MVPIIHTCALDEMTAWVWVSVSCMPFILFSFKSFKWTNANETEQKGKLKRTLLGWFWWQLTKNIVMDKQNINNNKTASKLTTSVEPSPKHQIERAINTTTILPICHLIGLFVDVYLNLLLLDISVDVFYGILSIVLVGPYGRALIQGQNYLTANGFKHRIELYICVEAKRDGWNRHVFDFR